VNPPRQPPDYEEEFEDKPMSPDENRRLRRLLRDEDRARWFWSTTRIWVGYITAAIVGIGLSASYLKDALKGIVR
jgi:hypothetical protein